MMSFEETSYEAHESIQELLKHFGQGQIETLPDDEPPIVQKIWTLGKELLAALDSDEFEEISN